MMPRSIKVARLQVTRWLEVSTAQGAAAWRGGRRRAQVLVCEGSILGFNFSFASANLSSGKISLGGGLGGACMGKG